MSQSFRDAVKATQRSSLYTTYYMYWDAKAKEIKRFEGTEWQYRLFQQFYISTALIAFPVFLARCYHIHTTSVEDKLTIPLSYYATFQIMSFVLFGYSFFRPAALDKFLQSYESMIMLDRRLESRWLNIYIS